MMAGGKRGATRGRGGEEERGRGGERRREERPKLHSLSRSDLGKLGCHFRTGMIYTHPSQGERGGSRASDTCGNNDQHVESREEAQLIISMIQQSIFYTERARCE